MEFVQKSQIGTTKLSPCLALQAILKESPRNIRSRKQVGLNQLKEVLPVILETHSLSGETRGHDGTIITNFLEIGVQEVYAALEPEMPKSNEELTSSEGENYDVIDGLGMQSVPKCQPL